MWLASLPANRGTHAHPQLQLPACSKGQPYTCGVNAADESCEGALAGQPRCHWLPIAWFEDLFPLLHRLLHEQINWDLIDDRMQAQFREITSSRQRAMRRSDSFGIDMYADVI